jgi:hypothetical protein
MQNDRQIRDLNVQINNLRAENESLRVSVFFLLDL